MKELEEFLDKDKGNLIDEFSIPSVSIPGDYHNVKIYENGKVECECVRNGLYKMSCEHQRKGIEKLIKKYILK